MKEPAPGSLLRSHVRTFDVYLGADVWLIDGRCIFNPVYTKILRIQHAKFDG